MPEEQQPYSSPKAQTVPYTQTDRPFSQPDPSVLTTQQLWREIGALKELLFSRIDGMEKAIIVAHDDLVRVPTDVQKQVSSLRELLEAKFEGEHILKDEKFKKVEERFVLVENSRIEQKKDTATAVDAALKAAKEAVTEQNASNAIAIAKSEAATTKQIDQQGAQFLTTTKALDDKINDIKERLTKLEGVTSGLSSIKSDISSLRSGSDKGEGKSAGIAQFIGWILAAIAIIGFVIKMSQG